MGFHNLINNRQPQTRAVRKPGLKGLKQLFELRFVKAHASVGQQDPSHAVRRLDLRRQASAARHRLERVVTDVPKDLADLIGVHPSRHRVAGESPLQTVIGAEQRVVLDQQQCLFE